MIIDFTQKKESIDISYVNSNRQISVEEVFLKDGYYNYIECEENDPNKINDLRSFHDNTIKIEKSHYFKHHNINEFFNKDIPKNYPLPAFPQKDRKGDNLFIQARLTN